jgi:hypothetical protein
LIKTAKSMGLYRPSILFIGIICAWILNNVRSVRAGMTSYNPSIDSHKMKEPTPSLSTSSGEGISGGSTASRTSAKANDFQGLPALMNRRDLHVHQEGYRLFLCAGLEFPVPHFKASPVFHPVESEPCSLFSSARSWSDHRRCRSVDLSMVIRLE